MKLQFTFLLAALCAAIHGGVRAADGPQISGNAEVTLPFRDVEALLNQVRASGPKRPEPPVDAAVTSANLTLDGAGRIAARFAVRIFADGWHAVPLVGAPFAVSEVEPADAPLVLKDGMICYLAEGPNQADVGLVFECSDELASGFDLSLPPVTGGKLEATDLPEGVRLVVGGNARIGSEKFWNLPADGGRVHLALVMQLPNVLTTWSTRSQSVVTEADGMLMIHSRINLTGESGSGSQARLTLPPRATLGEITGPNLRATPGDVNNAGSRTVELDWQNQGVLDRVVEVRFSLPARGDQWELAVPKIVDGKTDQDEIFVVLPSGFAAEDADGWAVVDELPSAHRSGGNFDSILVAKMGNPKPLRLRKLPRLEVDRAQIASAEARSRIVSDGSMLCHVSLTIRHRGPVRWEFSLPEESELLSCEVADSPVDPLTRNDGTLELPLGVSGDSESTQSTKVTFSYTAKTTAFDPIEGSLAITLPGLSLFTESLAWRVELPDGYEATAFQGNVQVDRTSSANEPAFQALLSRGDPAAVEIFYRKKSL